MNFNDVFSLPNYQILPLYFVYKLDINVCQVNVIKNKINLLLKKKIFIFSPNNVFIQNGIFASYNDAKRNHFKSLPPQARNTLKK